MDPPTRAAGRLHQRLPRTCGDGPSWSTAARSGSTASPHMRGWTHLIAACLPLVTGFPAHAGMDLDLIIWPLTLLGLPRTCGDGPEDAWRLIDQDAASPHMRGWTQVAVSPVVLVLGFPAHAGMDPARARRSSYRSGLPRTCGDGPLHASSPVRPRPASPHMRGWTHVVNFRRPVHVGFPAHAGMDPKRLNPVLRPIRLPRTCGDGPRTLQPIVLMSGASPHMRGWTAPTSTPKAHGPGFPAHAGMDPVCRVHARHVLGLPRTCGDGPDVYRWFMQWPEASPHMRGWTPLPRGRGRGVPGFPAHAGMDP